MEIPDDGAVPVML
jgi:hypothetical protein